MTALFVVRAPDAYNWLLGVYLTGGSFYFIYRLCGKPKPWWLLAGAALITGLILRMPGLYEAYVYPFILLASPIEGNGPIPSFFRILTEKFAHNRANCGSVAKSLWLVGPDVRRSVRSLSVVSLGSTDKRLFQRRERNQMNTLTGRDWTTLITRAMADARKTV
jgi:hypothetical protein